MNSNEAKARAAGVKLADESGAPKTAKLIADKNACFRDIFASAMDEIGPSALAQALKRGPREWGRKALNMLPNLSANGNELATTLAATADPRAAKPGDRICKFELYQDATVSGIVRINQTNDYRNLFKKNTYDFNPADQGIAVGTTVRMYFGIEDDPLVGLAAAPETFIFDNSSPKIAFYESWGLAGGQQFALQDGPGDARG